VIRFHLATLIANKGFSERRRLELGEISEATGIHRSTLSRVLNRPGVNLTADNMSRLCAFFGCSLGELAEYVPEDAVLANAHATPRNTAAKAALRKTATKPAARKATRRGEAQ
jgi:putative transcriptional regulator